MADEIVKKEEVKAEPKKAVAYVAPATSTAPQQPQSGGGSSSGGFEKKKIFQRRVQKTNRGDKVKKTIEFTNTGKLPLVINQAYGSCGCTVPKYDKEPVLPGKKGKLEIEFNSEHKAGANTKSVMIEANTNPPITTVTFSVKVNASEEKKGWFKK